MVLARGSHAGSPRLGATPIAAFMLRLFVYLLTMHRDLVGCLDAYPDLIAAGLEYRDRNVIADYQALTYSS